MILAVGKKVIGIIAVADVLKENSKEAVDILHKMGKQVAIITGDNKRVGEAIAKQLGIDRVLAEVLPQGKSDEIKKLQAKEKLWQWLETELMTRRLWLRQIWELPWGLEQMWQWKPEKLF